MSAFGSEEHMRDGEGQRRGRARQRVERPFYRHARDPGAGFMLYSYSRLNSVRVELTGPRDVPVYTHCDSAMRPVAPYDIDWESYDTLCVSVDYLRSLSTPSNRGALFHRILLDACRRSSIRRIELAGMDSYGEAVFDILNALPGIREIQADSRPGSASVGFVSDLCAVYENRFESVLLDSGGSTGSRDRLVAFIHGNIRVLREVFIPEPLFEDGERDAILARKLSECRLLETIRCDMPPIRFERLVLACEFESLREVVLNAGDFDVGGLPAVRWMHALYAKRPELQAITFVAPNLDWSHLPLIAYEAARFIRLRKFSVVLGKARPKKCPVEHASAAFDALCGLAHLDTLGIGNVPGLYEFLLDKRKITTLCLENSASRALDPSVRLLTVQRLGRIWVLDAEQEAPDPDVEAAVMDWRAKLSIIGEFVDAPMLAEMVGGFEAEFDPARNIAHDRYGPIEPDSPVSGDEEE